METPFTKAPHEQCIQSHIPSLNRIPRHPSAGWKRWPVKRLSRYVNALVKEVKSPFALEFYLEEFYLEEFYLGEFYLSKLRDFDSQL